jgi:predicted DNA-binding transcriptional regulator YafY
MTNQKNRSAADRLANQTDQVGVEKMDRIDRTAAGYSRPPLARMMRLHELLMANQFPNCRQLAEEFEVSAKTVQRDVNFMRDRLSLPIDYDKGRFGFRYTRAVSNFPATTGDDPRGAANPWKRAVPGPVGTRPALSIAAPEEMAVKIGFDAESARTVRARVWHPTQTIKPLPGGGAEMSVRTRDEWEIIRWVLSWGSHAWIIEPANVREHLREIVRKILDNHQD